MIALLNGRKMILIHLHEYPGENLIQIYTPWNKT